MANMITNKETIANPQWKVGDMVTFQCGNAQKKGVVVIVDAYGTFECPNIPSYDILVEEENMLYKHVRSDMVKLA